MSREYKNIIGALEKMQCHCESMTRDKDNDEVWQKDVCALQEAMGIISDYEKAVSDASRMKRHYETPARPVHRSGVWCCPHCGKRIQYNHSHCHWCGKRIGWEK